MSATTIATLKEEIARLEKELNRHRQALRILQQGEQQPKPQAPRPTRRTPQQPLRVLIENFLKTNASRMLTPSEITQGIVQRGQKVAKENVQRRLSDLFKEKVVTRKEGRYGLAK